jgi:uncharacterized membrane protein
MNLQRHKILFFAASAFLALLVASSALQHFLVYPQTEYFTEMWLLGSNQTAENYPYNVTRNVDYHVYLGLSNHLGSISYYQIQVKFRNQTMLGPDNFQHLPSRLPTLYSMNVFVADKQTVQLPINFSFDYTYDESKVNFNRLILNNVPIGLNGYSTSSNSSGHDFYGKLVFELWFYNSTFGGFQYHERYLDLRLNMTVV